jgi:hypothetical protein
VLFRSISRQRYKWKLLENWNRSSKIKYDNVTYLLLIENLKKIGLFEDADECYYNYRIERRKKQPDQGPTRQQQEQAGKISRLIRWLFSYKPIDCLLKVFYGYGVKPFRPVVWLMFLFLFFGILCTAFPSIVGFPNNTSYIDALSNSSQVFLSATKLVDNPNYHATGRLLSLFMVEKILASLFFAMVVISFGKTIIR